LVAALVSEAIEEEVEAKPPKHPLCDCANCDLYKYKFVPSTIPDVVDVAVVGEAPGQTEAAQGRPFVGPSGKLLDHGLGHAGVPKARVLLTNVVACHQPENETPSKSSVACCSGRLAAELKDVPTIVPVGVTASSAVFGKKIKIKQERVGPPKTSKLYPGARIIPTFHPAACLRTSDYFPSFMTDMFKITDTTPALWKTPQHLVVSPKKAAYVVELLMERYTEFYVDIETAFEKEGTFVQANHYDLLCIGVAFAADRVVIFDREACHDPAFQEAFGRLLDKYPIDCHNGKFDCSGLRRLGDAKLGFDTMLASYALDERGGIHDLGHVSSEWLGAPNYKHALRPYLDKNKSYANIPRNILHQYCAYDSSAGWQLKERLGAELDKQGLRHLHDYLVEASNVLMNIEMQGMALDLDVLHEVDEDLKAEMDRLHAILVPWLAAPNHLLDKKKQPKKVTAGSWQQVQRAIKYHTGTFTPSTDRAHLEELIDRGVTADGYLQILLEYRKVQKLWATYVNGIKQRMYDSRIHTSFLLHGTVTGRLSSRNPNLHNIPR
jgi:uracil-DNA glycosylase family 4